MDLKLPSIIDGGLSNVLEAQGCDLDHPLWTARLLNEHPEAIVRAHLAYLQAGAQCIITSSYQASVPGFLDLGYDLAFAKKLLLRTVELAERAIGQYVASHDVPNRPLIAASIGPYGAYLADGSEYRGGYGVSRETLYDFHRGRIQLFDRTDADLFACETIPSQMEAEVLGDILMKTEKSAWISFSCRDEGHLNDGTPIAEVTAPFAGHPKVLAVGVNCTAPQYVSGLIRTIKPVIGDKQLIIYPNSGETYIAESKSWKGTSDPEVFVAMANEWKELGADVLGGCCRIGPAHIRRLAGSFDGK
jgi:homocysteine S-methyltransferase